MRTDLDLELVREIAFDADGPSVESRQRARDALLAAAGRDTPPSKRRGHRALPRPRWPRVRDFSTVGLRAIPVLLSVLVTVGIAVVAYTEIGHDSAERPVSSGAAAGRNQLIDILAVLRRPQTRADLSLNLASSLGPSTFRGAPDLSLVRFATVTPWGEKLFFVPFKPPTRQALAATQRQFPQRDHKQLAQTFARLALTGETLGVASQQGGSGGIPATDIAARGELSTEGAGRSFAGGSTRTRLILVVPDGVAKVVFVLPGPPAGGHHAAPVHSHNLNVPVTVHSNVAAVEVDRECCTGQLPMIWYAADGHVTMRIGKFSSVNPRTIKTFEPQIRATNILMPQVIGLQLTAARGRIFTAARGTPIHIRTITTRLRVARIKADTVVAASPGPGSPIFARERITLQIPAPTTH